MTIEPWVYWIGGPVLTAGLIYRGIRFRRGGFTPLTYRNPDLPRFLRNAHMVSELIGAMCVPLLVLSASLVVPLPVDLRLPRHSPWRSSSPGSGTSC
jgi:hypothetical protein